jgi:acyl-CoA reductase-like NAD-dependent aldehyde dehydrogenase
VDRVIDVVVSESGKTHEDAQLADFGYTVSALGFWAKEAPKYLADERVPSWNNPIAAGKKLIIRYAPMGVIGVIGPWNYPIANSFGDCIPALAAGNSVILKPSEVTPLSSLLMEEMMRECGLPADVFQVATGDGSTGAALIPNVDCMMFTGSTRTGKKVLMGAAEAMIPCYLELGGKDPMIVLADADLDRAANAAAWGGMFNSGQVCISVERIYVEEPAYDSFVAKLTAEVGRLRQGADDRRYGKDVGAMTSPNQIGIVEDQVNDALANGARALTGGKRVAGPGDYFEPTVLVDVDHSMKVMRDETFGPVVGVMKVRDAEEGLHLANDSRYGLSGSVFGEKQRAEQVARRVECGAVNVNDVLVNYFAMDVPMGGWKESGIGYRHGEPGIKKYCRSESVVITRFGGKREPTWYPYTRGRRGLVTRIGQAFNARDWRRRLGCAAELSPGGGGFQAPSSEGRYAAGRFGRLMAWSLSLQRRVPGTLTLLGYV